MMMVMWALFFVAGWLVFGYGFARLREGPSDAWKWFALSATMFLVALIFLSINTTGG